jgi:outer membrane protein
MNLNTKLNIKLKSKSLFKLTLLLASLAFLINFSSVTIASAETETTTTYTTTHTLTNCKEMALRDSPAILAAKAEISRTKGVIWEVWTSILRVNAKGEYVYFNRPSPAVSIPAGSFGTVPSIMPPADIPLMPAGPEHLYTVRLEASLPVFTGGRTLSGLKIAYRNHDTAMEQYKLAVNDTIYNVTSAFYGVLLAKELVAVRAESLESIRKHYETTVKKYNVGIVSKFDVLRSEVELANSRPPLIEAKTSLRLAQDNLKRVLGVDVDDPFTISGELSYRTINDFSLNEMLDLAKMSSPELNIAENSEFVASKNVTMAYGEFLPVVTTFANYEWKGDDIKVISTDERYWDFTAGVMVTVPLFDLFLAAAKLKQANATYEMARVSLLDTKNKVKLDVKGAYYDLMEAKEVLESQKLNIKAAEESLRIAGVRYDNGISTLLELQDTRLALTVAKLNYIQALYNYEESYARLRKLVGLETVVIEDK